MSATPLTVLDQPLETLQMFCSWSEDVHVLWTLLSFFFLTFSTWELIIVIFAVSDAMSGYLVSATPPKIYSDLFETFQIFCTRSEDCMWFGHYRQVVFYHFFQLVNLSFFAISEDNYWVLCERNSSHSFIPIFFETLRGFVYGLKICMWFGHYCQIFILHFFHLSVFSITI